jgi:hypothetical protein
MRSPSVLIPVVTALALAGCVDSELTGAIQPVTEADGLVFTGFDGFDPDQPDACTPGVDCCRTDLDCGGLDGPCQVGKCPVAGAACVAVDTCGCTSDAWCQEKAPLCKTGVCAAGACQFTPSGTCCLGDSDCEDADPCTANVCEAQLCEFRAQEGPGCCAVLPVLDTSFAPAPVGLSLTSDSPNAVWAVLQNPLTPSPPASLVLHNPAGGALGSGQAAARFDLGPVKANTHYEVKLQQILDLPEQNYASELRVIDPLSGKVAWGTELFPDGAVPQGVWTAGTWTGFVGQSGNLELAFVFVSSTANDIAQWGLGVSIDDLNVRLGCEAAPPCTSDAQCQTGQNPCLDERCVSGECQSKIIPGCCIAAIDCPASLDPCAKLQCQANQCVETQVPGCCTADAECPGGDPCNQGYCNQATHACTYVDDPSCCTTVVDCPLPPPLPCAAVACELNKCVPFILPGCCTGNESCFDDSPCTEDACVGGTCVFKPIPGCGGDCKEAIFSDDFDSFQGGWQLINSQPHIGWSVVEHPQSCNGSGGLYYGDPKAKDNFGIGLTSSGTARSPLFALSASALSLEAAMWLTADIESGDAFDVFEIAVVPNTGLRTVVFDKDNLALQTCQIVSIDLMPWAGQTVQLEFFFDTNDGVANETFGLIVDDLEVRATCKGCKSSADCPKPGMPCEEAVCAGLVCLTQPILGCCTSDAACADGKTCTTDLCDLALGTCSHLGATCQNAAECASAPPCQLAQCTGGCCSVVTVPGCCTKDSECPPTAPCQIASCDEASGRCVSLPDPSCPCQTASDCKDGDVCTTDACAGNKCVFTGIAGCCHTAGDCPPGPLCTTPSCESGECKHTFELNCCTTNAQCDDKKACTVDTCLQIGGFASYCLNQPTTGPGCCINDAQCPDQGCEDGHCTPDFECVWEPKPDQCCETEGECQDDDPCTFDSCEGGLCLHQTEWWCCETNFDCEDFDPCSTAFCTADGICEYLPNGNCCTWDGQCFDDDPCTAEYCDFFSGLCQYPTWPGCCESPADCEDGLACTSHQCLFNQCLTTQKPGCCDIDAQCETGDDCLKGTCIQNQCQTTLVLGCCTTHEECGDQNPCTQDTCLLVPMPDGTQAGICQHIPVPGATCCASDAQCPAGGPCSVPKCSQFQCTLELLPGCCATGEDCGAPPPCSTVACVNQGCVTTPIPGCCMGDFQCEDGDPCTQDVCMGGLCVFLPTPAGGECQTDFECEDGDPCTVATCTLCGICDVVWAGCEDGNPCTIDVCDPFGGCAWVINDCDDGDPCTDDLCDPGSGQCVHAKSPACCTSPAQCNDGNPCTTDTCPAGMCKFTPLPGCCVTPAECDDGFICSEDFCVGGQCNHQFDIFCCTTDAECEDQNPCTSDACITFQEFGFCYNSPVPGLGCCTQTSDCVDTPCQEESCKNYQCLAGAKEEGCCVTTAECDDGDPCTTDFCQDFACFYTPSPFCECIADWECEDFIPCTVDQCINQKCVSSIGPGCCKPGASQATLQAQCGADTDGPGSCYNWACDPLWFECVLVTDATCCTGNAECADGNGCTTDTCQAGVCQNAIIPGCLCDDPNDCADGNPCTQDLGCVGGQCLTVAIPGCCTSDGQCADGDPCTDDVCTQNQCQHPFGGAGCCDGDGDCFDGLACTTDACIGTTCVFEPIPGCGACQANGDCPSDGNACTAERCLDAACQSVPIPGCCATQADCDDGNPATSDACAGGSCAWTPAPTQCAGAASCDDGNACTTDVCASSCSGTPGAAVIGDRCYQAFATWGTWFQAQAACEAWGGHLASQETPAAYAEMASVVGVTCGQTDFWNGFHDLRQEGVWQWADGTPTTGQEVWGPGEPNNCGSCCSAGSEDIGQTYFGGEMNDLCMQLGMGCFVCERLATKSCQHTGIAGCCTADADCDDQNPCTKDGCNLGIGACKEPVSLPGCCTSSAQCADGDVCTSDLCQGNQCSNPPLATCCKGAADCDDQDFCTIDQCQGGQCLHTPAGPGCCSQNGHCDDGDPCTWNYCDVNHTCQSVGMPPQGTGEICGDGIDNDCDPSTFCYELTTPTQTLPLTPFDGWDDAVAFYGYGWQDQASATTGYEISNQSVVFLYRDMSGNISLFYINDAVNDGSGGNLELSITGAAGLGILVYDDPPSAWSNDTYWNDGWEVYAGWQWGQCCTDGMVLGYLTQPVCLSFQIGSVKGLNGVTAWTDAGTAVGLDLSTLSFQICAVQ